MHEAKDERWLPFLRSYLLEYLFIFMCMNVCLPVCKCRSVCSVPMEVKESTESPGARVTGGCEQPSGSWESNPGLWQRQQGFLSTEPYLQHLHFDVYTKSLTALEPNKWPSFPPHLELECVPPFLAFDLDIEINSGS